MSLILEANIPANFRGTFYSLPLFLAWLPGILWERDEVSLSAAKQSFTLALLYILANGALFFLQGIFEYFLGKENLALAYALFSSSLLSTIAYLGFSFANAWRMFHQQEPLSFLQKASNRLEDFLSR